MYEKDEDNGNVGAQWKMAREVLKTKPLSPENSNYGHSIVTTYGEHTICHPPVRSPITNPIIKDRSHVLVDAGTAEFESHEDVMAKLLGKI